VPRYLAIGDIHGCSIALRKLCEFVQLRSDDVIITLGDYPDRGPDSKGVIDVLLDLNQRYKLVPLRGNHDIMMLDARDGGVAYQSWMNVGGDSTLASYARNDEEGSLADVPKSHWEFLEKRLLPYYETKSHFFVHGSVYPDLPLDDQPDYMLYWERFNDPQRHESGKIMICGHTSQKSGKPLITEHAICIDTRAYGSGWLSCLDVETGRVWQANQAGETRKL
jgi:serine/threonine protein phosphatase 1